VVEGYFRLTKPKPYKSAQMPRGREILVDRERSVNEACTRL
jgi:hypothetical protein